MGYKKNQKDFVVDFRVFICDKTESKDFLALSSSSEDIVLPASIKYAKGEAYYTTLNISGFDLKSVEHLLASLEACGVDNCRIEIENGREIPVIEGSAYGWTTLLSRVGVIT